MKEVNLYNAWLKLERLTEQAMEDEAVKKPITWALYNVWMWAGQNEEPRKDVLEQAVLNGTPLPKVQADILSKIRAEIEQFAENPNFGDLSIGASCGALKAMEIIDKYKAERVTE